MRSCPQCGARYADDLRFCLHDGATLVAAPTDDLSAAPTERYDARTMQEASSPFRTTPSAADEPETVISPPKTQKQYTFSAVDPASRMGCTMTFGKVLAALIVVAGLGLAAIVVTTSQYGSMTAKMEPTASNTSAGPPTTSNTGSIDTGGHSNTMANTMSNTSSTSNASSNTTVTVATRTPAATPQPTQTQITAIAPPKQQATPEATPADPGEFDNDPGRVVRGGILNGRATSLPRPAYPPAARAVGAAGEVRVRVLVNDEGTVIAANAVTGHPLLRSSAVTAARNTRFPPLGRRGNRIAGILVFNFP